MFHYMKFYLLEIKTERIYFTIWLKKMPLPNIIITLYSMGDNIVNKFPG